MKPRLSIVLDAASIRRGATWALRDVTLRLDPGQRWALLGDNGAGKTQLLKLLSGDVWPTPLHGSLSARTYRLGDIDIELIDAKLRMAYVGGERQDKYARYEWNLRVRDVVATGLTRSDLMLQPVSSLQSRQVASQLRACGLTRYAGRKFLSLSYGQQRLVLLARALVRQPDWLLLDEFYNGLDASFRKRIDVVLERARRRGQSWVATAHRAADVPRGTVWVLQLESGRVIGKTRLTRQHLEGLAQRADEAAAGSGPRRLAAARNRPAATRNRLAVTRNGSALISLSKVDLYVDYHCVLRGVDWQLCAGEHWVVLGANGAGKSSFLKLLYGDLAPALGGRMRREGFPPGTPISDWKRQVGLVSPELQSTYLLDVSLLELVASGRHSSIGLVDVLTDADRRCAGRWLRYFELSALAQRRPRELSYGQLRRALIARAMAADARILLLDEPFTGLDPAQRAAMKVLLERLMRHQVTVIAAVHHVEDLPQGMTNVLRLHNRRAITESAT